MGCVMTLQYIMYYAANMLKQFVVPLTLYPTWWHLHFQCKQSKKINIHSVVPHHSGVKTSLSLCLDIRQEKYGDMVRLTWMELNVKCPFRMFLPLFIYSIFSINMIQFKMWLIKYEVNSQGSLNLRNQVISLVFILALRWIHSSIYSFIHSFIK